MYSVVCCKIESNKHNHYYMFEHLSIEAVNSILPQGMRIIMAAQPDQKIITMKSLEALSDIANGQATKIIVPSNIQDVAGLLSSMSEVVKETKTTKK